MAIDIRVQFEKGLTGVNFDKREMRKAMRVAGRDVQKAARQLIARRVRSAAGGNPGKDTGRLWRSLGYKVSKSGFMAVVKHRKVAGMKSFYPAFLYHGVRDRNGGWRISPRNNYIVDALDARRDFVRATLARHVEAALKPAWEK
ncbi:HK97 gp10 family phage protein [Amantichitinum ursilacus]|uniref:Phage protein, HK97 gp10 family n=1 Tax=Amantichitinum ursilacus TaxID=857265 RepID=A0A0N0GNN8_9NEIS|nr:HK97 gp10 family phage protein [Amantichitinum ursilacus]KPC53024.1 hypothetical protein WG78_11055 [Amantichitinum ursilacus]